MVVLHEEAKIGVVPASEVVSDHYHGPFNPDYPSVVVRFPHYWLFWLPSDGEILQLVKTFGRVHTDMAIAMIETLKDDLREKGLLV